MGRDDVRFPTAPMRYGPRIRIDEPSCLRPYRSSALTRPRACRYTLATAHPPGGLSVMALAALFAAALAGVAYSVMSIGYKLAEVRMCRVPAFGLAFSGSAAL